MREPSVPVAASPRATGAAERDFIHIVRLARRSLSRLLIEPGTGTQPRRERFLRWMALENRAFRASAQALDAVHARLADAGADTGIDQLGRACRAGERHAAADLRRVDVIVPGPVPDLDPWRSALRLGPCGDPWRVVGVAALHAALVGRDEADALATLGALPDAPGGAERFAEARIAAAACAAAVHRHVGNAHHASLAGFLQGAQEGAIAYHLACTAALCPPARRGASASTHPLFRDTDHHRGYT